MSLKFSELQTEVKRRGIREQGGTGFDTGVKNLINTSLFRLAREALWRPLRRTNTFNTFKQYTTGTVTATNGSATVTGSGTSWISGSIYIGQLMTISGSNQFYRIQTITANTTLTTDLNYDGTTASALTYTIFGREEYNLPIQNGRTGFIWHEAFGYPYVMRYIPAASFYRRGVPLTTGNIPVLYRMWGEDDIIQQPIAASTLSISSSTTGDTNIPVTIFGTVSSYPDFETVNTNSSDGTTAVVSTKSYSKVERISKGATSTGRISVTSNSANVTVATLPVGLSTNTIQYKKLQLFPLPTTTFPVNVWFYKDPWALVGDNDVHEFGQDFDEAIILLSVSKIKAESEQEEAKNWFGMYKDELRNLRKVNADKLDYFPSLKRPGRSGSEARFHPQVAFSQVGGLFGPTEFPTMF